MKKSNVKKFVMHERWIEDGNETDRIRVVLAKNKTCARKKFKVKGKTIYDVREYVAKRRRRK